MAEINPIGIDQTTGQQRTVNSTDTVVNNIGDSINLAVKRVGDYSGGANIVQIAFPWDNPTRLADPTTLPQGLGRGGVEFSPNGEYMAVGFTSTPFINIYQRIGSGFYKLPDPATLPTGGANHEALAWSPNGEFLAIGHSTAPTLTIYQRSGNTFTKIANPSVLPAGVNTDCIHFSSNGEFMAVGHTSTPFITVYHIDGTTFTKLSDPSSLPANTVQGIRWSPNGKYLAAAVGITAPYFIWYEKSGTGTATTLTRLADPTTQPTSTGYSCDWNPNGKYVTFGSLGIPRLATYEVTGTTLTKLPDPASLPSAGAFENVRYSFDGNYLAGAQTASPFLHVYQVSNGGDTFTLLDSPASIPSGGRNIGWSPDGQFLAIDGDTGPLLDIYQTSASMPESGIVVINGQELDT
jgi:WD40 repeat protein